MLNLPNTKKHNRSVTHTRFRLQEAVRATQLGGVQVKGSGSGTVKGDVRVRGVVRLECKSTIHESYRLTLGLVGRLEDNSLQSGELPCIEVEFVDSVSGKLKGRLCVLPAYALDALIENGNKNT